MFRQYPEQVWAWYLCRLGVCRRAHPNEGHRALVRLEKLFVERFTLITQNVDGLHLRAGSSPEQTFQIHGNIEQDPFSRLAVSGGGHFIQGPAAKVLPEIVEVLGRGRSSSLAGKRLAER